MASMALSNRTLSGCFEPTLASGFTDFLLVHAMVETSSMPNTAINGIRRDICTSKFFDVRRSAPSTSLRAGSRLSAERSSALSFALLLLDSLHGGFGRHLQQRLRIL